MSSIDRQNKLLLAEDWKRIYQSFKHANFQSYDFENLRRIMIDYIRENYPEDFNDYIESSEYLALVDLIAFVGQNLAFRIDLNARDNFIELAERRESILRSARMLSYNPKRNLPAKGLLKFSTVQTTENIVDINGRNLSGQVVTWNDSSNPDWQDQFVRVINSALNIHQQFGRPIDKQVIQGIPTEQYRFNSDNTDVPIYSFNKHVSSNAMTFELTSTTFKNQNFVYEEPPKQGNKLAFLYRNDGAGPSSPNTGFFIHIVQGNLNTGTFSISQPTTNELVDIETPNINNDDIWLYQLDQNNIEQSEWVKVPSVKGNNVIFNSINKNIKNIYSVITRGGDAVTLAFSDGTFGNMPLGTYRVYYRVSNGLSYTINPADIRSVAITIPYISNQGKTESLSITLSLASSITNATPSESNDSIKLNAPAAYYTQNRMITGEDYNISPLAVNQQVVKIKSINRTSSGISRYFDLIDPSGKYSSTTLFAADGVLYKEEYMPTLRFSNDNTTSAYDIIQNKLVDVINRSSIKHFYYQHVPKQQINQVSWNKVSQDPSSCTGYFSYTFNTLAQKIGDTESNNSLSAVKQKTLAKFVPPPGYMFDTANGNQLIPDTVVKKGITQYIWAEIVSVSSNGLGLQGNGRDSNVQGAVLLSKPIPDTALIAEVIPQWNIVLSENTVALLSDLIAHNRPFGLRYDYHNQSWNVIGESNLNILDPFSFEFAGDETKTSRDSSWLVLVTADSQYYSIRSRELRYIFESEKEIEFCFEKSNTIYDYLKNKTIKDNITILDINTQNASKTALSQSYMWEVVDAFIDNEGNPHSKKLVLTFFDENENGAIDNPQIFDDVVLFSDNEIPYNNRHIIQQKNRHDQYEYVENIGQVVVVSTQQDININEYNINQFFYVTSTKTVLRLNENRALEHSTQYKVFEGRDKLRYQYNHSADFSERIDPGASNIIDLYVLTRTYDSVFRKWVNGSIQHRPEPPSSQELYNMLAPSLNAIKSMSDEIIYHPVEYKILFGNNADKELQAIFKVTKTPGRSVSDNDIKARIIAAINQFFELENWNFGDTFYFSELSAYVMKELAPDISNFIIVPQYSELKFGSLFEIPANNNQLFLSSATVSNVELVSHINSAQVVL